jgi:nuclear pore complex protein Nup155
MRATCNGYKGSLGDSGTSFENGVVVCRLSIGDMQVLEHKLRSSEKFLRSRRNQRRGLYGCAPGVLYWVPVTEVW